MSRRGPNVSRLIARKMSVEAIPPGGGFAAGLKFLASPELGTYARQAEDWVRRAIEVVKSAPDNPYGDDDEAIAGAILARIEVDDAARGRRQ